MKRKNRRLLVALSCYGMLMLVALAVLLPVHSSNETFILVVFLLVFALLIVKTIAHNDEG
jgi:hypothetical protein